MLDTADNVFSYYREYEGERWLVVANLSDETNGFSSEDSIDHIIIQNSEDEIISLGNITLKPWQAFVVKIK